MPPYKDDREVYHCKGCDATFTARKQAVKHEVNCSEARNPLKNFAYWISQRFMKKYGFDRRLRLTKMFEYLYFRFVLDILALAISILVVIGRLIAIYEIEGVPYSGSMEFSTEAVAVIVFATYVALDRFYAIEEFYYMVVQQMPKFKSELSRSTR